MPATEGPSLQARWLGRQLRDLREEAGMTLQEAASYLQRNQSTVSRFESADYPIRRPDVLALLELYGVSGGTRRDALLQLSEAVWDEGWWIEFDDAIDGRRLLDFAWAESIAQEMRLLGVMLVPGVLQAPGYAREAIKRWDPKASEATINRQVEFRIARKSSLRREDAPTVRVVMDEAVLHRPVGGVATHREQLRHFLDQMEQPNIEIRVIPLSVGWHAGMEGSFAIFDLKLYQRVGWIETAAGMSVVEGGKLGHLDAVFDTCRGLALDSAKSGELITKILREFDDQ
jgi:transcriptional regulator with XRE-family HTH domain